MKKKGISFIVILMLSLLLGIPSMAAETEQTDLADQNSLEMNYVRDFSGLLNYNEWADLEQQAEKLSLGHGCGVYIITVDDYTEYGSGSVYDVTTQLYHEEENDFGVGDCRDGITLLLSMNERDRAMFVYGDKAAYAFDAYGQERLEKVFLDNFGDDDWYGGFSDYLDACDEYLTKADEGKPVRKSPVGYITCSVFLSFLVALIVCLVLKGRMKTVYQKTRADEYTVGAIKLSERYDQYTHTTETRHKIEESSGSSQSESGGGGSGRSGKF